ncbi:MAG TPA: LuxR C-terminal-related transcriptional regulator [Candidatus Baltobacteraceae bacterium]|nr:LuxR C-terminal-related transcriptional regulator [Candidatus Baltobacteraceae bacterium]
MREFVQICALLGDPIEHRILSEMYPDSHLLERLIAQSERYVVNTGSEFRFKHAMLAQSVVSTIAVPIPLRKRIIDTLQSPNLQELTDYERIAEHAGECGDLKLRRRALVGLAKDAYGRQAWAAALSAAERALALQSSGPFDSEFLSVYVSSLRIFDRDQEAVEFLLPQLGRRDSGGSPHTGALVGTSIAILVELCRYDEAVAVYRRYEPLIQSPAERAPMIAMTMYSAVCSGEEQLYRELEAHFERLGDRIESRYVASRNIMRASFASENGEVEGMRRYVAAALAHVDLSDPRHPYLLGFAKMLLEFRNDGCQILSAGLRELRDFFRRDAIDFWFHGRLCEASAAFFQGDWETASSVVAATYRRSMPLSRAAQLLAIPAAMEAIGARENPFAAEVEALCWACRHQRNLQSALHVLPWWLAKHSDPDLEIFAEELTGELEKRAPAFIAISYVPLGFSVWADARSKKDVLKRISALETSRDRSKWGNAQWQLARGLALRSLRDAGAKSMLESAAAAFRSLSSPLFGALASHYAGETKAGDANILANIGLIKAKAGSPKRQYNDLTSREWDVARLVGEGSTNRQTAGKLFVSERTVEVHLSNIFGKLNLSSRAQLVRWFYETGESVSPRTLQ